MTNRNDPVKILCTESFTFTGHFISSQISLVGHKKKISLKDIALKAGVSAALVSYVLNGKDRKNRVRIEKAKQILQIAKDLNYEPNHLAKSLRSGKSFTIGLVIADICNPFFANIARIVENQARHHGYTVIYGSSDEDAIKSMELVKVLISRRVDGFILVSTENSEKQVYHLMEQNIPFVLLDRYFPEIRTDFVSTNNYKASFDAAAHLLDSGYKNIGLIAYKSKMFHMVERIRGYRDVLKKNKIPFKKKWLQEVRLGNTKAEVEKAIDAMLANGFPVDAIIFSTYSLAVNGLKYINKLGIKVPADVAVVSFGQAELFDLYACPITYVMQDMENLGKSAVDILVKKMENGKEKRHGVLFDAKLIIRESSSQKK